MIKEKVAIETRITEVPVVRQRVVVNKVTLDVEEDEMISTKKVEYVPIYNTVLNQLVKYEDVNVEKTFVVKNEITKTIDRPVI